jgi:hypothetical protein
MNFEPWDYDYSAVGDLVLDLRGDNFKIFDKDKMIWRDRSEYKNHLEYLEGSCPKIISNGINKTPIVRFNGNSMISCLNKIIEEGDQYTIISIARYSGKKRGRVISSRTNNWLFGFHEGSKNSLFTGSWIYKGNQDINDDWRIQVATVNPKEGEYSIRNQGIEIKKGEIVTSEKYSSIGEISLGAWRHPDEQGSECEISRLIIFKGVIQEEKIEHIEKILAITYSIGEDPVNNYLKWLDEFGESINSYPEIAKFGLKICLYDVIDLDKALKLIDFCNLYDFDIQMMKSDLMSFKGDEIEAMKSLHISYLLEPNNTLVIENLLNKSKSDNDIINMIHLLMVDSEKKQDIDVHNHLKNYNITKREKSNDSLLGIYYENEFLLLSGKYHLFFDKINAYLQNEKNIYSDMISNRVKKMSKKNPLNKVIIDKLNENKNKKLVVRYSTEYFKHNKRKTVGGFADRIKGATSAMMLSIVMNRRFELEWEFPFPLKEILTSVNYDWTVRPSKIGFKDIVLIDNRNYNDEYRHIFNKGDIGKLLDIEEVSIKTYWNIFDEEIMNNPLLKGNYNNFLGSMGQPELVGSLLSLFEYRPNIIEAAIAYKFISLIDMFDDSIAIHFRTGGDGEWEDPEMDSRDNVHKLFDKGLNIIENSRKKTCIFFATDSVKMKKEMVNIYGKRCDIFILNIPIAHIDRTEGKMHIIGSRFSILENFLISMCNHILSGKGAYSVIAANRRNEWPWRYYKTH